MIVAGFGFRTGASEDSFADALRQATTSHSPQALATIADKTRWLSQFAYAQSLPLITVAADQLVAQATLTQSATSMARAGTGSVAEATALAAAGPGARLAEPRFISTDRMATCAIAIGDTT